MHADDLSFTDSLEVLERAVAEGHGARVLDALLATWRLRRLPELTDAIEALSKRFETVVPPIAGKTERARYEQLLDLVTRKQSTDVARIVAELPNATVIRARDHVDRLAAMDPDPRVARALVDHVATRRFNLHNTVWTGIFRELRRHGDVRAREALARIPLPGDAASGGEKLRDRMVRALAELPESFPVSADVSKRLAAVHAALDGLRLELTPAPVRAAPARDETELFAAMLAKPDDDAPRLILADHYTEQGDPRGELISLQVKLARGAAPLAKDLKREKQLLKQHLVTLLGPLEPVVDRATVRYARGFLQHAQVKFKTAAQRKELLRHPLLSTLESVETRELALIRSEALPLLSTLSGLSWKNLVELGHDKPLAKVRRVEVKLTTGDPGDVSLERLSGLPSLTEAQFELFGLGGVYTTDTWSWLLDSPLKHLRLELFTDFYRGRLGGALAALDRRPEAKDLVLLLPITQSRNRATEYSVHITRAKSGYHVVLRCPEPSLYATQLVFEKLARRDVSIEVHSPEKNGGTQFEDGLTVMRRAVGDRVTVLP